MQKQKKFQLSCLIFEVTHRCNRECRFCYIHEQQKKELTLTEIETLFQKVLSQCRTEMVALSGGEPLLREDIAGLVSLLRELGVKSIAIITNGELLVPEKIENLVKSGASYFEVTLVSSRESTHTLLTGSTGFKKVIDALVSLNSFKMPFGISIPLNKVNQDHLREILELALVFGPSGIIVNRFNPGGRGIHFLSSLQLTPAEIQSSLSLIEDFCQEFSLKIGFPIPLTPCLFSLDDFPDITFGFCPLGRDLSQSYLTIDPSGNLRPCNHSSTVLGNLRHEDLRDLVKKDLFTRLVETVPGKCGCCDIKQKCRGGCRAAGEQLFGEWGKPDPLVDAPR